MKSSKVIIIFAVLGLSYFVAKGQEANRDVLSVTNNIEYGYFSKHLEFLASDELKGRKTASEGYAKAADYVAGEFRNNGLLPFGDNGTYFQNVGLEKRSIVESSIVFQVEKESQMIEGIYGKNISLLANQNYDKINEKEKLVLFYFIQKDPFCKN